VATFHSSPAAKSSRSAAARARAEPSARIRAIRAGVERTWWVASSPSMTSGTPAPQTTAAACGSA
jgi:hypothetical protein